MEQLNFGKVDRVFIFGGGKVLPHLCLKLKEKGIEYYVYTSKRLIEEKLDGVPFGDILNSKNIKYELTDDINNCESLLKRITGNSLGISFGAPWIFKKKFIELFRNRLINKHSRNLPKYRGGGGFSWLILNEERESANLLHLIDTGIDTGKIIKINRFTFPERCRIPQDYEDYSAEKDIEFMDSFIDEIIKKKTFELITQDESISTYYPRLHTHSQVFIDWGWGRDDIIRFINAFDDPYCGASTFYCGKRVFLKKCSHSDDNEKFHPFLSGIIYRKTQDAIFVAAKGGGLKISEIFDENGSKLQDLKLGQRLITPVSELEKAKRYMPTYGSRGLK